MSDAIVLHQHTVLPVLRMHILHDYHSTSQCACMHACCYTAPAAAATHTATSFLCTADVYTMLCHCYKQSEFICPPDPCPGDCDPEYQCERIPSAAAAKAAAGEPVTALVTTTAAAAVEPGRGIYTYNSPY
jgi:hypothetical protein